MKWDIHDICMPLKVLLASLAVTWGGAGHAGAYEVRLSLFEAVPVSTAERDRPLRTRQPFTLTVGRTEGDLQGKDDKIIQAAVDYVARLGGGTVRILPGVYELRNSIFLRPHITLQGSGPATILKKAPSFRTRLARNADFCEWGVRVQDANGFRPGDGILVRAQIGTEEWECDVLCTTITRIEGRVLFLDQMVRENFQQNVATSVASVFPLLAAEKVDDVEVKDLVLDGNRAYNDRVHGNFCGAVFLFICNRWRFTNVTARDYNGDGFSFQICDNVQFRDCQAVNNAFYGFHPGGGAQHAILQRCTAVGNGLGIYVCWDVSGESIEDCTLAENRDYGISIGHRDTDNTIRHCTVRQNGKAGIVFRNEGSGLGCSSRNQVIGCTITDNGRDSRGVGIAVEGRTHDITIANTQLINTPDGWQRTGVRICHPAQNITLEGNTFEGGLIEVDDRR